MLSKQMHGRMMTLMSTIDESKCRRCGQTEEWHRDNRPQHRFDTEAGPLTMDSQPGEKPRLNTSGDPILRIALIRAGILTPQEIDQAAKDFENAQSTGQPIVIEFRPRRDNATRDGMGTNGSLRDPVPTQGSSKGDSTPELK